MKTGNRKYFVLFLSNSENNAHLIAENLAREMGSDAVIFSGASFGETKLNSAVKRVLAESGVENPNLSISRFKNVKPYAFHLIITIGDSYKMENISLPEMLPRFHWEIPDYDFTGDEKRNYGFVKEIKTLIEQKLLVFMSSNVWQALFAVRNNLKLILDNLLNGVMAHTSNRVIFFFNKAAEEITGHKQADLLGKDCHDVFPGRFCDGECEFCFPSDTRRKEVGASKKVDFTKPDGKIINLKMSTMPLREDRDSLAGAIVSFTDETELETLKNRLKHHHSVGGLLSKDPKMLDVFEQIKEVSRVQAPVLIQGESGTGKELIANAIHDISPRADKPFVAINCGALPEGIIESELFGHVKGAFTGATREKKGRFELAHNGTLFLDEVGELSPPMQVKLLRVLQEKTFEKVGGEKTIKVNARVISATNQNLRRLVKDKKFRRDLFYRLCVVPITPPPLRKRRMDIPMLLEHFIELVASEFNRSPLTFSNEVIDVLAGYSWPGNVRELRNAIEYAFVKSRNNVLKIESLPPEIVMHKQKEFKKPGPPLKLSKEEVIDALSKTEGNRKEVAKTLGIGRSTLYRYLKLYGLI